jgi:hypothetical protein
MKKRYIVTLRDAEGEEYTRLIFANHEIAARERAVARARIALSKTMEEYCYGRYEILSCKPVALTKREAALLSIVR